jgi:hypothetical protein
MPRRSASIDDILRASSRTFARGGNIGLTISDSFLLRGPSFSRLSSFGGVTLSL